MKVSGASGTDQSDCKDNFLEHPGLRLILFPDKSKDFNSRLSSRLMHILFHLMIFLVQAALGAFISSHRFSRNTKGHFFNSNLNGRCILKQLKLYSTASHSGDDGKSGISFTNPNLRPYQQDCIRNCLDSIKAGYKRLMVSLPVGSGKTVSLIKIQVIFSELMQHIPSPFPGAHKVLKVELEKGEQFASPDADVVIASVPTLGRQNSSRLESFSPKDFKLVIIDEAHHSVALSYMRIFNFLGLLNADTHLKLFGFTATAHRNDDLGLGILFEKIAFHLDIRTLLNEKWLCDVDLYSVKTNVDLSAAFKDGKLDQEKLSLTVNTPERNLLVAKTWKEIAHDKLKCKSTLVFAVDLAHIQGLYEAFRSMGFAAATVDSSNKTADRNQIIDAFRNGKFSILINCGVLTEGTDIPNIDCLVMARPTNSKNLYIQMVGRGLRLHAGKNACAVIDVGDNSPRFSLVTFPSLQAAESPKKPAEEKEPEEKKREKPVIPKEIDAKTVKILLERSDPWKLSLHTNVLDWISISSTMFLLSLNSDEFLLMLPAQIASDTLVATHFKIVRMEYSAKSTKVEQISQNDLSSHEVIDFVFEYLKNIQGQLSLVRSDAFWKRKPISHSQFHILKKIYEKTKSQENESATSAMRLLQRTDRGCASRLISKYYFYLKMKQPVTWEDLSTELNNGRRPLYQRKKTNSSSEAAQSLPEE